MRALIVNCTLKTGAEESDTAALAEVVADALEEREVEVERLRAVDLVLKPGVSSDEGEGDEWPGVREHILDSETFVLDTPSNCSSWPSITCASARCGPPPRPHA